MQCHNVPSCEHLAELLDCSDLVCEDQHLSLISCQIRHVLNEPLNFVIMLAEDEHFLDDVLVCLGPFAIISRPTDRDSDWVLV